VTNYSTADFRRLQPNSTNVIDLARIRADRACQTEFSYFFDVIYPRRIRQRAARLREYAEAIERQALTCNHHALDWLDVFTMRPLERAIEEHEQLVALGRQCGWTR
jgi:hypothetical protein